MEDIVNFIIERKKKTKSLPNTVTSPGRGMFMTISMIIFCMFPLTGALISGTSFNSVKQGEMINKNTRVAKDTLIINIIVTIVIACVLLDSIGAI